MWISVLLIGFGIPSISPFFSAVASLVGLVPLLYTNKDFPFKTRFIRTFAAFTIIYAIQLVWFLTHPFLYIYPAWILLSSFLALQVAIPIALLSQERLKSISWCAWTALFVVVVEYLRLHILCGFSFYPLGLSLCGYSTSRLALVYLGMSGLTFMLVFSQALFARFLLVRRGFKFFLLIALVPYLFGNIPPKTTSIGQISVGIIDTNYPPDMVDNPAPLIKTSEKQMCRLIDLAFQAKANNVSLLIAPEIYVTFSPWSMIYSSPKIFKAFERHGYNLSFPNPHLYALEILQTLSCATGCTIIIGLEGRDNKKSSNSAYCIYPNNSPFLRYDKQVLVPLGEYIPFSFLEPILYQYGITGAFTHGSGPVLFPFKNFLIAPSICYEETFPNIIRKQKMLGANLLVNLSNDNWFPDSRLAQDHFEHARIISTELGCPLIRACNMGKSAIIDENGTLIPLTQIEEKDHTTLLTASINVKNRTTPYENLGAKKSIALLFAFCVLLQLLFQPQSKK